MENNAVVKLMSFRSCGRPYGASPESLQVAKYVRPLTLLNNAGFTLIELLVVVLIIAVLAAVALPQYQKAVEKSKGLEALTLVRSVGDAGFVYYLTHGDYPTSFADLDIGIPWTGNEWAIRNAGKITDTRSNKDWSLQLQHNDRDKLYGALITRLTGKYKGAAFMYVWKGNARATLYCTERIVAEGTSLKFTAPDHSYCQGIFKGSASGGTNMRYYTLTF